MAGETGSAVRAVARAAATGCLAAATLLRAGRATRAASDPAARWGRAAVFAGAARRVLALHGVRVRIAGFLPRGPVLLVANHVSYLDPIAVASVVACAPISKADLARWPVFGAVARRTGVLFHDRGDTRSGLRILREARRTLQDGLPVLNFPEGTTTAGGPPLPFRLGLFGMARRAAVPVVPLAITYLPAELAWVGEATFLPHYLGLAARAESEIEVIFGAPLAPEAYGSAADLARAAHGRVAAMLEGGAAEAQVPAPALATEA
jgi:1-acyl-sn-glycerol-3-phosphate acyltransferase